VIFKKRVYNVITIFLFLLLAGTLVYHNLERWGYLDSLYFTVVTMTTIGYGDFTPQTDIGKIFTIFFVFSGIATAFYTISLVTRYIYSLELRSRTREGGVIKVRR
jgi:voltage-gated potassium channel Kch